VEITALHGFLGLPSDWDFLKAAGFKVSTPPLHKIPRRGDTLIGYSMGGRLALQALIDGAKYKRAVIVSTGLGIEGEEARARRRAADQKWARHFETEPWGRVMRDWNAQSVFGGHEQNRAEADYDRKELARQLREWSPAVLPPLAPRLNEIKIPVLWVVGERDAKYVAERERALSLLEHVELWVCPAAGHRVPWEQPGKFIERLKAL
jgi:2-succinyl-6-hydroxy-2,4-cyclohexadiene-1-carboxylate synthase